MPASKLTSHQQAAILAAVASGKSQMQVAQDFNTSQQTVSRLVRLSRKNVPGPENVLNTNWRDDLAARSINAMKRVDEIDDPAKAVAAGTGIAKGLGLLGESLLSTTKVEVWLSSPIVAQICAKWEALEVQATTSVGELPDNGDESEK